MRSSTQPFLASWKETSQRVWRLRLPLKPKKPKSHQSRTLSSISTTRLHRLLQARLTALFLLCLTYSRQSMQTEQSLNCATRRLTCRTSWTRKYHSQRQATLQSANVSSRIASELTRCGLQTESASLPTTSVLQNWKRNTPRAKHSLQSWRVWNTISSSSARHASSKWKAVLTECSTLYASRCSSNKSTVERLRLAKLR